MPFRRRTGFVIVPVAIILSFSSFRSASQPQFPIEPGQLASSHQPVRPLSFAGDIGRILTKYGCNGSDCHGSVKGKGGFKLSLNALDPREDYRWIVEGGIYQVLSPESGGPKEPRINLEEPEKSLLLFKPTFAIPHEGGEAL